MIMKVDTIVQIVQLTFLLLRKRERQRQSDRETETERERNTNKQTERETDRSYTVCPRSSDPAEKIFNIFASENEVYTIY